MPHGTRLLCLLALTSPAAAQDSAARGTHCFRGGPPPGCRSFWITEASYLGRITGRGGPSSTNFANYAASLDLGLMRNLNTRTALGGTVSLTTVEGVAVSIRPRVRRWLTPTTSLDFGPGLVISGVPGTPRPTADLSFMWRDQVGIVVQTFVLPSSTFFPDGGRVDGNRVVTYGGLKLGSKLGLYGAAADALALLVAIGAYAIACASGCD